MSTPIVNFETSITIPERNLTQEQQRLALQQGTISESDLIVKNWESAELLIRNTISSINFMTENSGDYSLQICTLKEQSKKLTQLFDRIGEIILNEPTFCRIKHSTILAWGTSIVGLSSGGGGVGIVLYNYLKKEAPSIAPVLLTAGGVAVVGFQVHIWNKLKHQQEERTKLLILRGRCEVITEAREMARLLEKLMRMGRRLRPDDQRKENSQGRGVEENRRHELLTQLRNYRERVERLPEIEKLPEREGQESHQGRIKLRKSVPGYTAQALLECSRIQTNYQSATQSNSAEAPPYFPSAAEGIEMRDLSKARIEPHADLAGEQKTSSPLDTVLEMPTSSTGFPKDDQDSISEVDIFGDK